MTNETLGIIYAIKQAPMASDRAVAYFMGELTGNRPEQYTRYTINSIIRNAATDYIETCDNPAREFKRLLNDTLLTFRERIESEMIFTFLSMIQVCDETTHEYINGFKDNPYAHFAVFNMEK